MDITEGQRVVLGQHVEAERARRFGTKSGAYQAAGLNSATWDRIEAGLPVRDDRLIAAVRTLWPSSGGDWHEAGAVMVAGERTTEQRLADLEARVEKLERVRENKKESDPRGDTAATKRAGASPAERFREVEAEDLTERPAAPGRSRGRRPPGKRPG